VDTLVYDGTQGVILVTKVCDKRSKYTDEDYLKPIKPRGFQNLWRPSTKELLTIICDKLSNNFLIYKADIIAAEDIFGYDI
jgi:hypothetical protein